MLRSRTPASSGRRSFRCWAKARPDVLKRSPEDRAALIERLYGRSDALWLAEALMDIEEEPDDLVRLRLIVELERMFGG